MGGTPGIESRCRPSLGKASREGRKKRKDIANALKSQGDVGGHGERKGIGGNPKFTMRNNALKAAKEAKGGSKLTLEEVRRVEREALEEYECMRQDPDEYRILYEQYRQEHVSRAQRRLDAESHAAGSSSGPEASGRQGVRVFGGVEEPAQSPKPVAGADDPLVGVSRLAAWWSATTLGH